MEVFLFFRSETLKAALVKVLGTLINIETVESPSEADIIITDDHIPFSKLVKEKKVIVLTDKNIPEGFTKVQTPITLGDLIKAIKKGVQT